MEEDPEPSPQGAPITRPWDLWFLDKQNYLWQFSGVDSSPCNGGRKADVVFVDLSYNVAIDPGPPTDKSTIQFEAGRVQLPEEAPWLDEYVREVTGLPGSKFNDQVESTTQALDFMAKYCGLTIYDLL